MSGAWTLERGEAVATIRLDRPDKHNILAMDEVPAFIALLDALEDDENLRVLVITGTGDKSFSAGVDLSDVLTRDWTVNPLEQLADRVEALRMPTVCALNGNVFGGATDLALACDFRIGVAGMKLVMPPAKLGVVFHESGLRRYVERLGPQVARRLFLLGEQMSDETLLQVGYLDRVVGRPGFQEEVAAFVATLAANSPLALAAMKQAIVGISRGNLDSARLKAQTLACFRTQDAAEGLAASRERRAPVFKGR
ncbi:MAG: enoyl-CoA hydratase-related protein [Proteobacteria bacterium]|nr:enoyl-CoA hydratase-related protein [Pseudomonadota bacterium]